jgi:hypothetical protein
MSEKSLSRSKGSSYSGISAAREVRYSAEFHCVSIEPRLKMGGKTTLSGLQSLLSPVNSPRDPARGRQKYVCYMVAQLL